MSRAGECALANVTEPQSGHVGSLLQLVFSPRPQLILAQSAKQIESSEAYSWIQAVEICGGAVLILGLTVIVHNICMKGNDVNAESDPVDSTEKYEKPKPADPTLFDMKLDQPEKCDFALGFPLRSNTSKAGIAWDAEVDGLRDARRIFRDPSKQHLVSEEELNEKFCHQMRFEEYHNAVCNLLLKLFTGGRFGLEMGSFPSIDDDEVFLTLRLPRAGNALSLYAAQFSYKMALSDAAYSAIQTEVPKDKEGYEVRAYTEFIMDREKDYVPFRQADKLRLLRAQMEKHLNVSQLMVQNVLIFRFSGHYWKEVVELSKELANPWFWYKMPDHDHEDRIRDYFGEEVAWMFVWQACYARALLIPAGLGTLVYFRRFFVDLDGSFSHEVQLAYAVVMIFWAAFFNGWYRRREVRLRQRWGMEKYAPQWAFRDEYQPELENSFQVYAAMVASDLLALALLCIMVIGNSLIHQWQMGVEGTKQRHWIWHWAGSLLITTQIIVIDRFWFWCSLKIVDFENHTSREKYLASWARKMFMVRIINNLYPFIYTGFIKEHYEGCPDFKAGCIGELQANLLVFFIVWILKVIGQSLLLVITVRWQVLRELSTETKRLHQRDYTYLELQAKCPEYDDALRMDDWTESVLSFAFLACFNVVLPAIAPIALITNLVRIRLMHYRNLHLLQRPVPRGANGIGAWQQLCEIIEVLAVIVNVTFAVFILAPMRHFQLRHKWLLFVVIQYAAFLLQLLLHAKVPSRTREIEDQDLMNREVIRKTFLDSRQHSVDVEREELKLPELGSRAFIGSQPVQSSCSRS